MTENAAGTEFDRQVRTLVDKGYPELAGLTERAFRDLVGPLRDSATADFPPTRARVPFALVVSPRVVRVNDQVSRTELNGNPGFSIFEASDIGRYEPIDDVELPAAEAYLICDVDRGAETLNQAPDKALPALLEQGRSPLTVAEGIAFVTQFPASLEKNNCFSLPASRCGDKRVPALWISKKAPKLGWCWAGNPHTWLGSASCVSRRGTPPAGPS